METRTIKYQLTNNQTPMATCWSQASGREFSASRVGFVMFFIGLSLFLVFCLFLNRSEVTIIKKIKNKKEKEIEKK